MYNTCVQKKNDNAKWSIERRQVYLNDKNDREIK